MHSHENRHGNFPSQPSSKKRYHFATGNWSLQKGVNTGVVQMIARMSVPALLSHLRRVSTPINRDGKSSTPRQLHASEYGIFCPAESPEGSGCGLIKNMALLSHLSLGVQPGIVEALLQTVPGFDPESGRRPVFVNGNAVGYTDDPDQLVRDLRSMRRAGDAPWELSVHKEPRRQCVFVYVDAGRCTRPMWVLENIDRAREAYEDPRPGLWGRLLALGCIEYLDKTEEEAWAVVAVEAGAVRDSPDRYTHVEIDPIVFLSLTVAMIPFCDRNQAPRNMYQASMGKQALSVPMLSFDSRMSDTHMFVTPYAAKALVDTYVSRLSSVVELTRGTEMIVAICAYTGFGQEDSTIWNKAAIERGLGVATYYHVFTDEITSRGTEEEIFERPPADTRGMRAGANYAKLEADGIVGVGTYVEPGDVVIGKTVSVQDPDCGPDVIRKRDRSTVLSKNSHGYVDKVMIRQNRDGKPAVTVRIAQTRWPEIGDKFSSRHGQKGTIGLILPPEDMPFTQDGITPDVIVNPNALPSRMTIAQLMECVLGKACALAGRFGDGTPFRGTSAEDIASALEAQGFRKDGKEIMYSGITGEMMDCAVFIGPTYYQRLKHMVRDKEHSRARGPKSILVRQPLEGRSREGGLRFGEMERDALLGHGAPFLLSERMCTSSDGQVFPVCRKCGRLATPALSQRFGQVVDGRPYCKGCQSYEVGNVELPYATKLLIQELEAMHIAVRLRIAPKVMYAE